MTRRHALLAALALCLAAPAARAVELVMVEQAGCAFCARWMREIGPIYPKTAEAAFAPLRQVGLRSAELRALATARPVLFTPTFLVVDETGRELGRLEGYPGEDFFWPLLTRLLTDSAGYVPPAFAQGDPSP